MNALSLNIVMKNYEQTTDFASPKHKKRVQVLQWDSTGGGNLRSVVVAQRGENNHHSQ